MSDYTTGVINSAAIPSWQRTYYEGLLLETLRTKSILMPYTVMKEDFSGKQTGRITYSEVYDTDPNFNPLAETDIWLRGAHLDSRSLSIDLAIYGDVLKFSDYSEIVQYLNQGDLRGLVRNKIGQNQVDTLDLLARNAFLSIDANYKRYGGTTLRSDREDIETGDFFDPDQGELARVHLEELEIPGIVATTDADIQTIVCVTTPRVVHDIRTSAKSNWLEVNNYAQGVRKFNGEVGTWGGVRYVRTNRLRMRNHGAIVAQTTLDGATVAGQGAAATVDTVYNPGQSNSTRYILVTAVAGFTVGQYVTIHNQNVGSGLGHPPVETDGTQETRRIVAIDVGQRRISFDKPLLKAHASGDFMTVGINIHGSIFIGGPSVVYAVGERPTPTIPPKMDDMMMINRYGWRGFLKLQMFRPEWIEVHESAGSVD